jgi:HTH domain in Mos1 transposase
VSRSLKKKTVLDWSYLVESGKLAYQTVPKVRATALRLYRGKKWFPPLYGGSIFTVVHRVSSDWVIPLASKEIVFTLIFITISNMSDIEYRAVITFFTRKGLNVTEIHKKLDNVYHDSAPFDRTVAKWVAEFEDLKRGESMTS